MSSTSNGQTTLIVNIISIVISALIVRAIYTVFECVKVLSDEVVSNHEDDYEETRSSVIRTLLISGMCILFVIIIYTGVKQYYKLP
jgi:hypothetical protein